MSRPKPTRGQPTGLQNSESNAEPQPPAEAQLSSTSNALKSVSRRSAVKLAAAGVFAASGSVAQARPVGPYAKLGKVLGRRQTGDSVFKQRAIEDYRTNMAEFGGRMSAPANRLLHDARPGQPWQFDVLVVGSGYGASISAARVASRLRPGGRLGVLERGQEWVPGTFPDTLGGVMDESRLVTLGRNKGQTNKPTGLFNVQQFEEITILSGSGLGGSSLINANVAYRPDPDVFTQSVWPTAVRSREYLDPYYELVEYELGANREPWDHTHKMIAQRKAADILAATGAHYEAANLTITRGQSFGLPMLNRQGLLQRPCIDCGDCLSGCNVGAKNTLATNYLPLARRAGAEFFTQTEVHRIEKCGSFYKVHYTHYLDDGQGGYNKCHGATTARIVILGAGSLGSSEILMRSQSRQLQLSSRLGCNWTGNGDALGFIRKTQNPTGIGGYSAYPTDRACVGPTIESNLTYPNRSLPGRVLIQDGSAARAYANALGVLMRDPDLDHLQILLGMGHDGAQGQMSLNESGFAEVRWPGLLDGDYRRLIRGEFQRVADAMGGEYKYLKIFGDKMISVHPLGGCGMSDDPNCGVVNHRGQVYDTTFGGDADRTTGEPRVHEGLYVIDGAMLPTSIACNPFLTISALAERSADLLVADVRFADLFTSG